MKLFLIIFAALSIAGCATTYVEPAGKAKTVSISHNMDKKSALSKAKRALILDGFQIQSYDDEAGFISTSFKFVRLTLGEASCGTTFGLDYLKDNRTKTEVAINILVDEKTITIKSTINGEYKPGSASQDITLSCVSKGVIERRLASNF